MSLSETEAREYAQLLPDGLNCNNARERLLCVAEVLKRASDAGHRLSNADIRRVLTARFGKDAAPAENTLNADIAALRSCGVAGFDFFTSPAGSWCEARSLGLSQVRLLFNAVQSSRFLTAQESAELQESLLDLVSIHQEDMLMGDVHVVQRMEPAGRATLLDACETIAQALRNDRKVEFEYTYNDFGGAQVALAGDDGATLRIETPTALYFADGNYYLESYSATPWRHGQNIMRSRIDRMRSVSVSEEHADLCEGVLEARKSAARRMKREIQMFGGTPRTVFLRVSAEGTNEVFDLFGFGLEFANFSGDPADKNTTADTCVTVAQSPTFFRWLTGLGGRVRIVAPPDALAVRSQPWARLTDGKTHAQLMADYEAMADAYRAFLQAVLV